VFALCFWWYDMGLLLSIAVAMLTFTAIGLGVELPLGYFLGRRSARQFITRIRDAGNTVGDLIHDVERGIRPEPDP